MNILICLFLPLVGTAFGSAMVFLMRDKININLEKLLLGFASGVMVAASVWSLLIPSIEISKEQKNISCLPAVCGFFLGILFLLLLDNLIPHIHLEEKKPEGIKSSLSKTTMMVLAVTLHNIPEGMAVGISIAAALNKNSGITIAAAVALSLGIAIQNFPEGAIVSMPLKQAGISKNKSFCYGILSGIVEPIGALITILLTTFIINLLPYLLSFAAGAMIYVVVEELIPESQIGEHSNIGTLGFAVGFALMMVLDITLG